MERAEIQDISITPDITAYGQDCPEGGAVSRIKVEESSPEPEEKRRRLILDEEEIRSLAWHNFLVGFRSKVVTPAGASIGYAEIFEPSSPPRTMTTGLREVQTALFEHIYECYKDIPHQEISESKMENFLVLLEREKPGILKYATGQNGNDFGFDSPLHNKNIFNITRMEMVRKNWKQAYHNRFLKRKVTPTQSEIESQLMLSKLNPGRKPHRRGRSYLNSNALSYWDSSKQQIITDFSKQKADLNKLFRMNACVWKMHAPGFFDSMEPMKQHVSWLFEENRTGDKYVKPLDLVALIDSLPSKLEIFTNAVEEMLLNHEMESTVKDPTKAPNDPRSTWTLTVSNELFFDENQRKEARQVLAIRKFSSTVNGERSNIVVDNELRGNQPVIVMKTGGRELAYDVIAENCVMYTVNNITEALLGYFLVLFAGGLIYEKRGELFGYVLEMYFFEREQTMKPKKKDIEVYHKLRQIVDKNAEDLQMPVLLPNIPDKNL